MGKLFKINILLGAFICGSIICIAQTPVLFCVDENGAQVTATWNAVSAPVPICIIPAPVTVSYKLYASVNSASGYDSIYSSTNLTTDTSYTFTNTLGYNYFYVTLHNENCGVPDSTISDTLLLTTPNPPVIQSVSIENNQVSIKWQDTNQYSAPGQYYIYQSIDANSGTVLDSIVPVDSIITYQYTLSDPQALTGSRSYSVSMRNQCGSESRHKSDFSTAHNTIYLASELDSCAGELTFNWNPYTTWLSGVQTYQLIVFDVADSTEQILATTDTFYTWTGFSDNDTFEIVVRAISNTSDTAVSNQLDLTPNKYASLEALYLQSIRSDEQGMNELKWMAFSPTGTFIDYFTIRKTEKTGEAIDPNTINHTTTVGFINQPAQIDSQYIFTMVDPEIPTKPYYYQIEAINRDCADTIISQSGAASIWVETKQSDDYKNEINWSTYEIPVGDLVAPSSPYQLFLTQDSELAVRLSITAATTFSLSISENYNGDGIFCYQVQVPYVFTPRHRITNAFLGIQTFDTLYSNYSCVDQRVLIRMPNAINMASASTTNQEYRVGIAFGEIEDFLLTIFDQNGSILFESPSNLIGWRGLLRNGNKAPQGTYVAQVKVTTSGQQIIKEQPVLLIR